MENCGVCWNVDAEGATWEGNVDSRKYENRENMKHAKVVRVIGITLIQSGIYLTGGGAIEYGFSSFALPHIVECKFPGTSAALHPNLIFIS